MEVVPLDIEDVKLIRPRVFRDARGFFMASYIESAYREHGIPGGFMQDNHSLSREKGTVRGLHFQIPPRAQAKLVRVVRGAIHDVAVDIREGSPTFGQYAAATLTAENAEQLYVPAGFAHGFCTLEPDTEVLYKVDAPYAPELEGALPWNDPEIGIDWPLEAGAAPLLSEKDAAVSQGLKAFRTPFQYQRAA